MLTSSILPIVARPLIGAVIGYITNDIAIRMLFRPRTAKYVFGVKVPFTPGIIPKEKPRIAASIGDAISKNLMNREVIERSLLSDETMSRLRGAIDSFVGTQRRNPEPLGEFLGHYLSEEDILYIRNNVTSDLSGQIHTALASSGLGARISHIVVEHSLAKMKKSLFGLIGADQVAALVAGPAEKLLAKNIDEMLADNSRRIVGTLISDQAAQLLDTPVRDLLAGRDEQIEKAVGSITELYRTLVTERLPRVLDAVNISRIVEDRINEMDVKESEEIILDVMRRELRAIVWLGALLGFVMGCINLLF